MKAQKNTIANNLADGLEWLRKAIDQRIATTLSNKPTTFEWDTQALPIPIINGHLPNLYEYILLMLALAPQVKSDFFDNILKPHFPDGHNFPAFGGVRGKNHRGILPTGETAQFILAGNDVGQRLAVQQLFSPAHWFAKESILHLEELPPGEPLMSGRLLLDPEWLERMTSGQLSTPRFSTQFPAELLTTHLTWKDLVLPGKTLEQVAELRIWMDHHATIQATWDLQRHLKPGYRALFYGPPGTGKTLTATLLGQAAQRLVFRIDLSMVVSKYIGETEKNLASLFDKAANKDWILFFDEADALFGKRTEVRDARDKYANQETAFLLQRVEAFPGLVILASNLRKNIDEAFARRFQSIVYFPFPDAQQRLTLWNKILPAEVPRSAEVDLERLATAYELSGSNIVNIAQYVGLQMLAQGTQQLELPLVLEGIRREYAKEEKLL
ncbi:MAG: AAA family ATPase [Bacteroidetes bacterium]|nr:MAG: AAA family ATPase [Bacteroidota bacterium]PTM13416.1 MAG: AAA family ATPase [Bacteroidota bacterium]